MKLEKKQKVLLTLIIIALAFLAWQLYDIFFANPTEDETNVIATPTTSLQPISTAPIKPLTMPTSVPSITTPAPAPTPVLAPIPVRQAPAPTSLITPTPVGAPTVQPIPITQPIVTQQQLPTQQAPIPPVMHQLTLQAPITQQQREYLRLVNRYQIVKMQRLVADEEAAMYTSKAKVAELTQQISKAAGTLLPNNVLGPSQPFSIGYQLMYIDYQNGRWTATLNRSGRFIEVVAGTLLPDGARVLKINQSGVVVRKNNRNYLLNFYGTTIIPVPITAPPITTVRPIIRPILPKKTENFIPVSKLKVIKTNPASIKKCIIIPNKPLTHVNSNNEAIPMSSALRHAAVNPTKVVANKTDLAHLVKTTPPLPSTSTTLTGIPATAVAAAKSPALPATITTTMATRQVEATPTHISPLPLQTINHAKPIENNLPKKEVPLTPQQKNTVTQLESYIDNKKPISPENYSVDEKHLFTLPKEFFTLQIMGSYKLSDLMNLIKQYNLKDKAYTFHTYYLDKDWYVLIYGTYKTEDEALKAIALLPPSVQQLKPWVRTIASVTEAIKLNPKQTS